MNESPLSNPVAGAGCPGDEPLLAYLAAELPAEEQQDIDDHVAGCDRCVETLMVMHARLRQLPELTLPVPPRVQTRAAAALGAARERQQPRRLPVLLRLPILMPLSFAAGAALMIATQTWVAPSPPRSRTRAIAIRQTVPVTAAEAQVRVQPDATAAVIATLVRGDAVEVGADEGDWYQITLPNGRPGWIERHAFE